MTSLKAPVARAARLVLLCFAVLTLMNVGFLAVRLADHALPKSHVIKNLRLGFLHGSATTQDYPADLLIGADQYTDCLVFQLSIIGGDGWFSNALAPRLLSPEGVSAGATVKPAERCQEVKRFIDGQDDGGRAAFTRFWNGPASFLSAALMVLPLDGYRGLLLTISFGLIALSAVLAAATSRRLLLGLTPLFVLAFMLDGQIGYGTLISHAPALILSWLVATLLIALGGRLDDRRLMLWAVAAGCLEAFSDYMISVPLAACIFLITAVAVSLPRWRARTLPGAVWQTMLFAGAWVGGFLGTYVYKLAFTLPLLGWGAVMGPFVQQLRFRAGAVDPGDGMTNVGGIPVLSVLWANVVRLCENFWHLGYMDGHPLLVSYSIAAAGGLGWLYAGWRLAAAVRGGRWRGNLLHGLGYVGASLLLLAWVAAFPEHTWRHVWFMVRSAMIWLAAGWGWALTDLAAMRAERRRDFV